MRLIKILFDYTIFKINFNQTILGVKIKFKFALSGIFIEYMPVISSTN